MKISIITPTYNAEKYIEQTIRSVLEQQSEEFNLEHIIMDGASSDQTASIVNEYVRKYPGIIRFISEKDKSLYDALNKGLMQSTGNIVGIITAGNVYLAGALLKVFHKLNPANELALVGGQYFCKPDLKPIKKIVPKFMNNPTILSLVDCHVGDSSVFFKKEFFESLGNYNLQYIYSADFDLYYRYINSGRKFIIMEEALSKFIISDDQLSTKFANKQMQETMDFIKYPNIYKISKKTKFSAVLWYLLRIYQKVV
ncbi:glycosyltransferase [Paenibacillus sp. HJGM_3]|uniref:glycosyltransferase n=1 Tax=Paenibacillus sp. HJGM_3 TaxID=3379816 RepID=UPI00385B0E79